MDQQIGENMKDYGPLIYIVSLIINWYPLFCYMYSLREAKTYGDLVFLIIFTTFLDVAWPVAWACIGLLELQHIPL